MGEGYTKKRTFTSAVGASLAGSPEAPFPSPEKNEFGICIDAPSRCFEGLLTLFSLFLVDLL